MAALSPSPMFSTPAAASTFSIPCPACEDRLHGHPHPSAPHVLSPCGHSICGECARAVLQTTSPVCPVCELAVEAEELNVALGELAEVENAEVGDWDRECLDIADDACTPAKRGRPSTDSGPETLPPAQLWCPAHPEQLVVGWCSADSRMVCAVCATEPTHTDHDIRRISDECILMDLQTQARELAQQCSSGAQHFRHSLVSVGEATAVLAMNKDSAVEEVKRTRAELVQAAMAMEETVLKTIVQSYEARLKRLQRQAEVLAVSADQLESAGRSCFIAAKMPGTAALALASACHCAARTTSMCGSAAVVPCVRTELEARMDTDRVLLALSATATVIVDNSEELARQALEAAQAAEVTAAEKKEAAYLQLLRNATTAFSGSTTMTGVPDEIRTRFANTLVTGWLPQGMQVGPRLYCASVDGNTPRAFHAACDNKGPTLVLIRLLTAGGHPHLVGGFAGMPWASRAVMRTTSDTFTFVVTAPEFGWGRRTMLKDQFQTGKITTGPLWGPLFGVGPLDHDLGVSTSSNRDENEPMTRVYADDCDYPLVDMEVYAVV